MKPYSLLITFLLIAHLLRAQSTTITTDTSKKPNAGGIFTSVEKIPEFPGGIEAFSRYISKNLKYPDIARLIGMNGKVRVSFVVDRDGKVTNVMPINCIGAGCDAEAVNVLEMSPHWKPGIQDGMPVRVEYTVPITFSLGSDKVKVYMANLRTSGYGFVFSIKGVFYTIDEAEAIMGKSFISDQIDIAEPFYNYDKVQKFEMPDKKEVYLIIMKSK